MEMILNPVSWFTIRFIRTQFGPLCRMKYIRGEKKCWLIFFCSQGRRISTTFGSLISADLAESGVSIFVLWQMCPIADCSWYVFLVLSFSYLCIHSNQKHVWPSSPPPAVMEVEETQGLWSLGRCSTSGLHLQPCPSFFLFFFFNIWTQLIKLTGKALRCDTLLKEVQSVSGN